MCDSSDSLLEVAESLEKKAKSKLVDPLIAAMAGLARRRFGKQRATLDDVGRVPLAADVRKALGARVPGERQRYEDIVDRAYNAGGAMVTDGFAGEYSRDWAEFSKQIDATSFDRVESIIKRGMLDKLDISEIRAQVNAAFKEWASKLLDSRASGIGLNEVSHAFHEGMLDAAAAAGKTTKSWECDAGACEICIDNSDDGELAIDEPFSSGDDSPPAHVWCRCSLKVG